MRESREKPEALEVQTPFEKNDEEEDAKFAHRCLKTLFSLLRSPQKAIGS